MKKAVNRRYRSIKKFGHAELLERKELLAADVLTIEPVDAADAHGAGCACPGCCTQDEVHFIGDGHNHDHNDIELLNVDFDSLPGRSVDASDPLLREDQFGNQFYFDPAPVLEPEFMLDESFSEPTSDIQALPPTAPIYHSKPGAARKIFLDFDGQTVTGTSWNQFNNGNPIVAPPYSTDGNLDSFNSTELNRIEETWRRVSEDYAAFDVDVTTEDPGSAFFAQGNQGIRVIISTDVDSATGNRWYSGAGGVAYLNSWSYSSDTPVWSFYNNLGGAKAIAEASSHEAGHALNLSHDGTSSQSYYQGHGSGQTGWAPIMGVGYSRNVTQWSRGEYNNANNSQNDLAIITSRIPYQADDHGDSTTNTASATPVTLAGTVLSGAGIIERSNDLDVFSIGLSGGGNISVSANTVAQGPNLDIELSVYDQNGNLLGMNNPSNSLNAAVTLTGLADGIYLVAVDGVGYATPANGFSDYASLGQYTLSGSVVSTNPNTAPNAGNDAYAATEDTPLNINAPGVLSNDTDPNDDPLTVNTTPAVDPVHGTVTLFADGSFEYVPDPDYFGTDSFQYQITDGNTGLSTGTVTLTVNGTNDNPDAANDSYVVGQGQQLSVPLIDSLLQNDDDIDGDSLQVNTTPVVAPPNGVVNLSANGTFTYLASPGFFGTDTFTYEAIDGNGGSSTADVTITVTQAGLTCENHAPGGILGDGFTDLMYNPVTGLMTVRIDSDAAGDGVNAIIIPGPEPTDIAPDGAPFWGAANYFAGKIQLIIYNGNINLGMEVDRPLLQYPTGLTAADFASSNCVEYGTIGDVSNGITGRTVYAEVAIATDTAAPSAVATADDITSTDGIDHSFDVTFNDDVAIEGADILTGVVMVTGPNGYSEIATVTSVAPAGNAGLITATLSVPAAGGTWDAVDQGTYTISIVDYAVTDTSNNFLAGGVVGSFDVDISTTTTGDFNNDGEFDCDDIDTLGMAILAGSTDPIYDVDSSGTVDTADLTYWVTDIKGTLVGDANLDFVVDGNDFLIWNANKFTSGTSWCTGDFDGNGTTDGNDFLLWNGNKFQSAAPPVDSNGEVDRESDSADTSTVVGNVEAASSIRYEAEKEAYQPVSLAADDATKREDREDAESVDFVFGELGSL